MRCSVKTSDWIFVKGCEFLSFSKNVGKNISKNVYDRYNQKLLDYAKKPSTDSLKITLKDQLKKQQ